MVKGLNLSWFFTLMLLCYSMGAQTLSSVRLAWDPSTDPVVISYRLYWGISSGVYTNMVDCGTNITGTATGLVGGETYFFIVRALGSNGMESEPSNELAYSLTDTEEDTALRLVTTIDPGTVRNDFTGFVGLKFQVGSKPLLVSSLGRYALQGNQLTHKLRLVRAADGADVVGGTATVEMNGAAAESIKYVSLPSPITLQPGASYYLVSEELKGGDTWYEADTRISTTPDVSAKTAVWAIPGEPFRDYGPAGACYVVLDFKYEAQSQSGPTNSLISSVGLGTARNDFTGWVGLRLRVGSEPLLVGSLGRFKTAGNTGQHTVKLMDAMTGLDVPGASVTVSMSSGVDGQFTYAALPSPVLLSPASTYYLITSETAGGDTWYNVDTTVASFSSAQVLSGVWGFSADRCYLYGGEGNSYGPVSLLLADASSSPPEKPSTQQGFVRSINLQRIRNDYTGFVGMRIEVGSNPLVVTELGRITAPGNSAVHTVKLVRGDDGVDVPGGSAIVSMGYANAGGFQYGKLAAPLTLSPGTSYLVVSSETVGSDTWYDGDTTVTTSTDAKVTSAVWRGSDGRWYNYGSAGQTYVPVDFRYTVQTNTTSVQIAERLVNTTVAGRLRNDVQGWAGLRLQVGSKALKVTSIGRYVATGNRNQHTLKIVRASDGADVAGASTVVNLASSTPGKYVFGSLAAPVTLDANTAYYVLSSETHAGDLWSDIDSAVVASKAATITCAGFGAGDGKWYDYGSANQCFGPVDLVFTVSGSGEPESNLVTSVRPGRLRNDFTGYVGMKVSVGRTPLQITELGRWVNAGNYGSHTVKILRASDGSEVPGGTTSVATAGVTSGTFAYAKLPSPIILDPEQDYFLVSHETLGGDTWFDVDATVTTTSAASVLCSAWGYTTGPLYVYGGAGQTHVVVDFKYVKAASTGTSELITSQAPGTKRSDFTGWVGARIAVGTTPLKVAALGRFMTAGNNRQHTLRLVRASDGVDVPGGTTAVNMSGGVVGKYVYGQLSSTLILPAGEVYYLVCSEEAGGDSWYNFDTSVSTSGVAGVVSGVWGFVTGQLYTHGSSGYCYGPVNLRYEP